MTTREQNPMQRFVVGDCEMLPRAKGNYILVRDVVKMLGDICDDDHPHAMLTKITEYMMELALWPPANRNWLRL